MSQSASGTHQIHIDRESVDRLFTNRFLGWYSLPHFLNLFIIMLASPECLVAARMANCSVGGKATSASNRGHRELLVVFLFTGSGTDDIGTRSNGLGSLTLHLPRVEWPRYGSGE